MSDPESLGRGYTDCVHSDDASAARKARAAARRERMTVEVAR